MKKKKHFRKADPHYQRERKKYDFPIPSREYILSTLSDSAQPTELKALIELLGVDSEEEQQALLYRLSAMIRDGQLHQDRRGRYCVTDKLELIRGTVQGHPDGYGFLIPDNGSPDLFLSPKQMKSVIDGDKVLVKAIRSKRQGQSEAVIHELLERRNEHLVGTLFIDAEVAYVEPANKRIPRVVQIPKNAIKGEPGQIVSVELLPTPKRGSAQLIGKIIEILGEQMAPGVETEVALRVYGIPFEWPTVIQKAQRRLEKMKFDQEIEKRIDCRDKKFITIDGKDARDFDDAVYCESLPAGGWRLWVAIADVSYFVQSEDDIDIEAQRRGNSVYFPQRVVPMLPEILSNQLCSLLPEADRLTMICEMHIKVNGELSDYRFYESVIHSRARMTYTEVSAILEDNDPAQKKQYQHLLSELNTLYDLFKVLANRRQERGAIEFDCLETRIIFDEHQKIENIVPTQRRDAHRLIEECMLLANVCAAKLLEKHKLTALFRIHEAPSNEKVIELREFLAKLGLSLGGGKTPETRHYSELLASISDRSDKHLIQMVVLRSLSQAVYSPDNVGHFGLAYAGYTHFTSPIRRYPDLIVHRALKHILTKQAYPYTHKMMEDFGHRCSETERRADEATRDVVLWLKCEYMRAHLGAEFMGVVSAVTHFGLFLELESLYIEGLLHVTALPNDYYHFDPIMYTLTGERSGKKYTIGDKIKVLVSRVDLDERKIDFEMAT